MLLQYYMSLVIHAVQGIILLFAGLSLNKYLSTWNVFPLLNTTGLSMPQDTIFKHYTYCTLCWWWPYNKYHISVWEFNCACQNLFILVYKLFAKWPTTMKGLLFAAFFFIVYQSLWRFVWLWVSVVYDNLGPTLPTFMKITWSIIK